MVELLGIAMPYIGLGGIASAGGLAAATALIRLDQQDGGIRVPVTAGTLTLALAAVAHAYADSLAPPVGHYGEQALTLMPWVKGTLLFLSAAAFAFAIAKRCGALEH